MATVRDVTEVIEQVAPPALQESYDNAGMQVGDPTMQVNGVLLCLDVTEAIVDEAIDMGANLIVSHHPLLFKGLKRITGHTYIERVVMKALRHEIAIYAAHTNMDATLVNHRWAQMLGLVDVEVLQPTASMLVKLVVFVPRVHTAAVKQALYNAGAGCMGNYESCSYTMQGEDTFCATEGTHPFCGEPGKLHTEVEDRVEVVVPRYKLGAVTCAMLAAHPYEEPAYDIIAIENDWHDAGMGVMGKLPQACTAKAFLERLKASMQCDSVRYTRDENTMVQRIALCGGGGAFLADTARARGAQLFVTGEVGYHHFFGYPEDFIVAEIGHYESERHTKEIFYDVITKKFTTFATCKSKVESNPIKYL